MGRQNEDVVSITRAVRANRMARAAALSGNRAASATAVTAPVGGGSPGDPSLIADEVGDRFDVEEMLDADDVTRRLVEDHLWLVDRLAGQTARRFPRYVERTELWSAGVLGLVEAARRFDTSFNVPFAAYASARVRGEMLESARSADLAPRRLRRSLRELAEVVESLTQQHGRVPSLPEVAEAAHIDVQLVRDRLQTAASLQSMSLDDDSGSARSDQALATMSSEPSERLSQQELLGALREAVAQLPEPLKSILVRSHWNNERLVDIAEEMGISFQRVAQYRVEAITALAAWFATLYEAVPVPDANLPGTVRRAAFCSALAALSNWRARLEAGSFGNPLSAVEVGAEAGS